MNDFASHFSARSFALVLPTNDKAQFERYVAKQSTSSSTSGERFPFRRQVDFWAFSIAIAVATNLNPLEGPVSKWGTTFIYTSQGILNENLCSLLAVIAVARMGHDNPDAMDPSRIIDLANRLAGAGCPIVLKKLSEDTLRTTPMDRVIELSRSLADGVRSA